jgi:uncharacterized membrane protein
MRISRANLLSLAMVVGSFAAVAALCHRMPDPVPVHWDARGHVNGFMSKPWGALVMPLTTAGAYLVTVFLPRISPRGFRLDRFRGTFEIIQLAIVAFLFFGTMLVLMAGAGIDVPLVRSLTVGAGVLLVVLGNVLGKVTKNFFVGIRTPWTLASDEVWLRTHRLGGRVFVAAGLAIVVSGLAGGGTGPILAAALAAVVIPIVYSYVAYRRLEGPSGQTPR